MTIRTIMPLVLAGLTFAASPTLFAQDDAAKPANAGEVPTLDQGVFIDGLSKGGYPELLSRMITLRPPQTELEKLQIEVASDRLTYQQMLERSATLATSQNQADLIESVKLGQEAEAAFKKMLEGMVTMSTQFAEADLRPMWQTDLSETLLTTYVGRMNQNADDFVVYGIAGDEQQAAFSTAAGESYIALTDADLGFADRQVLLPRDPDHTLKRVNTGLWDIMMDDYWAKSLPYFHSQAALYIAEAPDDAPYYKQLLQGGDKRIAGQKKTIAEERKRLNQIAIDRGDVFLTNSGQEMPAAERMIYVTQGMAHLNLGNISKAVSLFDQVLAANDPAIYTLRAGIGRAFALAAQDNIAGAQKQIQDLTNMPLVRDVPLYRLLLADAEHRILLEAANKKTGDDKAKAVAASYDPYLVMFNDKSLGPAVDSMRVLVYDRWNEQAAGKEISQMPPAVRFGAAESMMMEAQRLFNEGKQANDTAKLEQARAKFDEAIKVYETLRGDDVSPVMKASAMYNDALANYQVGQTGVDQLKRTRQAINVWVMLGDQLPDQPKALEGLNFASQLLQYIHALPQKPEGIDEQYIQTVQLLCEKFPDSNVTASQRLYYGMVILMQQEKWKEAMDNFAAVPANHKDYFAAQRERLFAMSEWLADLDTDELKAELEKLKEVKGIGDQAKSNIISDIEAQAQRAIAGGLSVETAKEALMAAAIVRARIAMMRSQFEAPQENLKAAVAAVADFENKFPEGDRYIPQAMETRLLAMAALGDVDEVAKQATVMIQKYPDEGAAIISDLLDQIEAEIDTLRARVLVERSTVTKQELEDRIKRLSRVASGLADKLVGWAKGEGMSGDDLIPYQLIQAKTKMLAGDANAAMGILKPVYQQYPKDPTIMSLYGEALIATGTRTNLQAAQQIFNDLIRAYQNDRPLPAEYWNSWVRWLEAAEQLGQNSVIGKTVQSLRGADPNLGGQPYKRLLEDLQQRN